MSTPTSGHKKIRTIVITGGPCGGKTTAMSWLQNALTSAGYAVIFLTETFTELANGGISSYNCKDNFAFQRIQVRYQLERERLYRRAAEATRTRSASGTSTTRSSTWSRRPRGPCPSTPPPTTPPAPRPRRRPSTWTKRPWPPGRGTRTFGSSTTPPTSTARCCAS